MERVSMDEAKTVIRILIVDDHPLVRRALGLFLEEEKDFEVCGEAEDAETALALIESTRPEIVILDITLKNSDGFAVLKEIKDRFPSVKVFFFSAHEASLYGLRAIRGGASGYLTKGESHCKLLEGLRRIAAGEIFISDHIKAESSHPTDDRDTTSALSLLTNRELEVFRLIGHGQTTEQIAEKLNLSSNTVQSHRAGIRQKLQLGSSAEIIRCAFEFVNHGTISSAAPHQEELISETATAARQRSELLLNLLKDGRTRTAAEIAQQLHVSPRTVLRDLRRLRDVQGKPIRCDSNGFRFETDYPAASGV